MTALLTALLVVAAASVAGFACYVLGYTHGARRVMRAVAEHRDDEGMLTFPEYTP